MNDDIELLTCFVMSHDGELHGLDCTSIDMESISIGGDSHHGVVLRTNVTEATIKIENVPENLRAGGALSCPVLITVTGDHDGGLEVRRQKRNPSDDDGTETWVLSERPRSDDPVVTRSHEVLEK